MSNVFRDLGCAKFRDVNRHQLRNVVAFELELTCLLLQIQNVLEEREDGLAGDEHLDRVSEDGNARNLLGLRRVRQVVGLTNTR